MTNIRFKQKWTTEVSLRINGWNDIEDTLTILKIPTTRYSSSGDIETYDWQVQGEKILNSIFKIGDQWQLENPDSMLLDYIECLMENIVRIKLSSGKIMCFPKGKIEIFTYKQELKEHGKISHTFENKEDMIEIEDKQ